MSQECSTTINPREDVPPATQPTLRGTFRPPLALPSFRDGNIPSHTQGRYWGLLNNLGLTPPSPNRRTPVVTPKAFQGLTNQPQAASLPQIRATVPQNEQPPMTRSVDNLPHFSPKSDQAPSGDAAKRPEPAPSASGHSFPDPNTLSSDSIDSLREQLRLVNQRIDDVHKTLRTKDEHGEGPLRGPPFVQ
ncbi:hypothetical protein B296_00045595 [Ensete ventricosum]|uniref:Uncharacterized protein n=1 Tax=Ensete ventricosum TaxID=4639 RepID=A0A426Z6V2_ENSVE|nr:hypothetical protein B296_00045595 [Ensete ventricosum]